MHFKFENVNDAFDKLVEGFEDGMIPTVKVPSRVGDVMMIQEPVIVTYEKPLQRVLFNKARDANPFFHVYESLWMLAGRNDLKPLQYYASKIGEFVDDGDGLANGAYGYRWRHALMCMGSKPVDGVKKYGHVCDQLELIIDHLRRVPTSRRVVLQMWNVEDDLLKIGPDNQSRDVCCNTAVYFSLREVKEPHNWDHDKLRRKIDQEYEMAGLARQDRDTADSERRLNLVKLYAEGYHLVETYLDMTVTNRSNDLTLGMLGANVVHFSFLQEYIANCLGVEVGVYNQFSNNLHAYTSRWYAKDWLAEAGVDPYRSNPEWNHIPLVRDQKTFDEEVKMFVEVNYRSDVGSTHWQEPFLQTVAQPMMNAFHYHKRRDYWSAMNVGVINIADGAWQLGAWQWIEKRRVAYEKKQQLGDDE